MYGSNVLPRASQRTPNALRLFILAAMAALVAACGGSGSATETIPVTETASCNPDDASTFDECGVLYLAVTDGDGDFLSYVVDVVSLSLQRDDGTTIEVLPNVARVDFSDYVELTEFVSAANVPPGTYVSGTIRLDYSTAEVFVESNGEAVSAAVVDSTGTSLDQVDLEIMLPERDQLTLRRGLPSLLLIDFDLAASHTVDLTTTPAMVVAEPFIVADIEPVDEKDIRVRGPLVSVSMPDSTYTIQLRPFHRRDGNNGQVDVHVVAGTEFEIDGMPYKGEEGLRALDAAGQGTPTRAFGTLNVEAREFTATEVLAGSSVPGIDFDAVKGHVIARDGDRLTVRGATIMLTDRDAYFNDNVTVAIGPETAVFKSGHPDELLDTSAISVGQNVLIRGTVTSTDPGNLVLDATTGRVRMYVTRLSGIVNQAVSGQIDIDLSAIGRRRPALFDFTGTGGSVADDADPDNYEVSTGPLNIDSVAAGSPVRAYGFPNAFGFAPPDFEGRTVIDYDSLRATLGIGWTAAGSTAPFLSINPESIVPDPEAYADDARHAVKIGPRLIDLTKIEGGISIIGVDERRTLYGIRGEGSVQLFRSFGDFSEALSTALDGETAARSMYAHGAYDVDTREFAAYTIWVHLLR